MLIRDTQLAIFFKEQHHRQPSHQQLDIKMKDGLVPLFLFLTLLPICGIFGYWFAKWFLQERVTELDRGQRAADTAHGADGAN
jgi:hypothetical protein